MSIQLISPSTHWSRIFLLWLCGVSAAMQFAKVSVCFDALLELYRVTPAQLGFSLSIVGVSGLIFGVTAGLFAHAMGFRRLLLVALALGAALSYAQTLTLPYPIFFITRMFEGVSHLIITVIAPVLITSSSGRNHRSITIGLWSTFFAAGFSLTSLIAPYVLHHFGLRGIFLGHAIFMSVMWLAVYFTLEVEERGVAHFPSMRTLLRQHLVTYRHFNSILPGLCFMCYTATSVALMTFIPNFVGEDHLWVAPMLPIMSVLGTFTAGWVVQKWWSPMRMLKVAFSAVIVVGLGFYWLETNGIRPSFAALAVMFVGGMAGGASFAMIPYLSDRKIFQVRANGALAQLANVGATIGPPLFASAISSLGLLGLVMPLALFGVMGVVMAMVAMRHIQRHTKPQLLNK